MSAWESKIEKGVRVVADAADGTTRGLRALGGVIAGGDFAVVWACSEREWNAAEAESREPEGIPWPAEDVAVSEAAGTEVTVLDEDDPLALIAEPTDWPVWNCPPPLGRGVWN